MSSPGDPVDPMSTFGDKTGRWSYEDSLGALVPVDLVASAGQLLEHYGYGDSDFIWEKARLPSARGWGCEALAGAAPSPGRRRRRSTDAWSPRRSSTPCGTATATAGLVVAERPQTSYAR